MDLDDVGEKKFRDEGQQMMGVLASVAATTARDERHAWWHASDGLGWHWRGEV